MAPGKVETCGPRGSLEEVGSGGAFRLETQQVVGQRAAVVCSGRLRFVRRSACSNQGTFQRCSRSFVSGRSKRTGIEGLAAMLSFTCVGLYRAGEGV